jgi:predicted transcriptional regulator
MKVKKIKVQVKSLDDALDEFVKVGKRVQRGQAVKSKTGTYVADAEIARGIFTESRLQLLQVLKHKMPSSIYQLAKLLHRDFKNVYDDVIFLADIGIVGIKESTSGRKQKKPTLLCRNILFEIAA